MTEKERERLLRYINEGGTPGTGCLPVIVAAAVFWAVVVWVAWLIFA